MNRYILIVFGFINVLHLIVAVSQISTSGYYWRDFEGSIPIDALSAGHDSKGHSIYIGQVLIDDKLIPGKIHEGDKNIYYELSEQAWSTDKNIKILCTTHAEFFEWIPTNIDKTFDIATNNLLVKGGHEPGFVIYIGRNFEEKESNVGKVVCRETKCLALYTALNGKQVEYHSYEVLAYNANGLNSIIN